MSNTKHQTTAAATFDEALVSYVEAVHGRIVRAGVQGRAGITVTDLNATLHAIDPRLAAVAADAVTALLRLLEQAMTAAATRSTRSGAPDLMPSATAAASAVADKVNDIVTAVQLARNDPKKLAAVTDADAAVQAVKSEQAAALAGLQRAVEQADVEAVMRLRPEVEVVLPSRLDAAHLALIDARLAAHQATSGHAATLEAAAQRHAQQAEARVLDARQALEDAMTAHNAAAMTHAQVARSAQQTSQLARALLTERATLATTLEQDRDRRFRRLAGLTEPAPATTEQTSRAPTPIFTGYVLGAGQKVSEIA